MPAKPRLKTHRGLRRPHFERIALVLQGGGALGSYQGGVYQALAEAGIEPDWITGISIGAINSAIIAGNPPGKRVEKLREFWETVSQAPAIFPNLPWLRLDDDFTHKLMNQWRAAGILLRGAPGFFTPRLPPPYLVPAGNPEQVSFYDVAPLRDTLLRLVDFNLINAGEMRFAVGAVNVRTGNFTYFDNATYEIGPEHIMASGSLPPGFPPTRIDGEYYWDGGLVSNTPLQYMLDSRPRLDTIAFQVDLWASQGEVPRDLAGADVRQKEIRFSSRTRAGTDRFRQAQRLRRHAHRLLEQLPPALKQTPEAQALAAEADEKNYNIVEIIYHAQSYEGSAKDYEFSRRTMEEHWSAGYHDAVRTLRHEDIFRPPEDDSGVRTFDVGFDGGD
ncbi:patatin-like phospholipase family protein [Ancylobacter terrae]|uniref:patatin-like phospholipase family protein n=1 Tax=Ancylobacter sp. sgz301288 TaxID=3342077 RepID=UPI00385E2EAB